MLFKTETLKELMWGDTQGLTLLSDEQCDSSRWSSHHELVFLEEATGKTYSAEYSQGLTESQDESPFDDEGEEVDCVEVEAIEVISIYYLPITPVVDKPKST